MIVLVAGGVGAGKTTALEGALAILRARSVRGTAAPAGYLSERVIERGETVGYDLADLSTGARRPLLRRGEGDGQRVGPYRLLPDGLAGAEGIIAAAAPDEVLVVDEIGPLELAGRGVWPALASIARDPARRLVAVVRETLLEDFGARLAGLSVSVVRLDREAGAAGLAAAIARALAGAAPDREGARP